MTFTLAQHRSWLAHPTGDGPSQIRQGGMCVGVIRRSWGQPTWGESASAFWAKVPASERHHTNPADVPEGATCYYPVGRYGHVWTAAPNLQGWTTDYVAHGTLRLAPMALPRWTNGSTMVWWTSWSPHGRLPVGRTHRQATAPAGVPVRLANLKYGVRNNADVVDLQRALNRHLGINIPTTGNYLDQTDNAVRTCQSRHGFGHDPAGRSFVGAQQARHLGLAPS